MAASSPGSSPFPLWRKKKRPFSPLPPPWKWVLRRLLNDRVIRSLYVRAVAKKKKRDIRLCEMYWSYLLALTFKATKVPSSFTGDVLFFLFLLSLGVSAIKTKSNKGFNFMSISFHCTRRVHSKIFRYVDI